MYEQYLIQARAAQHQQDRMKEGANEHGLHAKLGEQGKRRAQQEQEQQEPVVAFPRIRWVRRAWQALYSFVASLL